MTWILRGYLGVWGTQEEFGEEKRCKYSVLVYKHLKKMVDG